MSTRTAVARFAPAVVAFAVVVAGGLTVRWMAVDDTPAIPGARSGSAGSPPCEPAERVTHPAVPVPTPRDRVLRYALMKLNLATPPGRGHVQNFTIDNPATGSGTSYAGF